MLKSSNKVSTVHTFSFFSFFSRRFSFLRSLLLDLFPSLFLSLRCSFLRCEAPSLESELLEIDLARLRFSPLSLSLDGDIERCFRLCSLDLDLERDIESSLCLLWAGLLLLPVSLTGGLDRERARLTRPSFPSLVSFRRLSVSWSRRLGDLEDLSLGIDRCYRFGSDGLGEERSTSSVGNQVLGVAYINRP